MGGTGPGVVAWGRGARYTPGTTSCAAGVAPLAAAHAAAAPQGTAHPQVLHRPKLPPRWAHLLQQEHPGAPRNTPPPRGPRATNCRPAGVARRNPPHLLQEGGQVLALLGGAQGRGVRAQEGGVVGEPPPHQVHGVGVPQGAKQRQQAAELQARGVKGVEQHDGGAGGGGGGGGDGGGGRGGGPTRAAGAAIAAAAAAGRLGGAGGGGWGRAHIGGVDGAAQRGDEDGHPPHGSHHGPGCRLGDLMGKRGRNEVWQGCYWGVPPCCSCGCCCWCWWPSCCPAPPATAAAAAGVTGRRAAAPALPATHRCRCSCSAPGAPRGLAQAGPGGAGVAGHRWGGGVPRLWVDRSDWLAFAQVRAWRSASKHSD